METHQLSIPYKGQEYNVHIAVEHKAAQCRIMAHIGGHEILFVANEDDCLQAVYHESVIDEGLMDEIGRRICKECL